MDCSALAEQLRQRLAEGRATSGNQLILVFAAPRGYTGYVQVRRRPERSGAERRDGQASSSSDRDCDYYAHLGSAGSWFFQRQLLDIRSGS